MVIGGTFETIGLNGSSSWLDTHVILAMNTIIIIGIVHQIISSTMLLCQSGVYFAFVFPALYLHEKTPSIMNTGITTMSMRRVVFTMRFISTSAMTPLGLNTPIL